MNGRVQEPANLVPRRFQIATQELDQVAPQALTSPLFPQPGAGRPNLEVVEHVGHLQGAVGDALQACDLGASITPESRSRQLAKAYGIRVEVIGPNADGTKDH